MRPRRWAFILVVCASGCGPARQSPPTEIDVVGYDDFYLGEHAAAVTALLQADQQDPFVLALLGQANERLGHADRAREYYGKVLQSSSHAVNGAFARPLARKRLDTGR